MLQMYHSGFKSYFRNPWNKTDQLMFAMLGLAVILRYTLTDDAHFEWIRNIYAVNLVMFYLRILQLFLVEKHLGPKVIMIRRMVIKFVSVLYNKCKKLQFIHKLTASDTSKTAKITKR